ncbi:12919_t:CDS:1 [Acaulospora colombiana]|uniref:12919_t:CDS:1 n=1 Tax=Acaulospora colombiana TaxID=27376 RepID=A0ACA9L7Q2_9GLOM|nr:12919_t:CDS:1 [Acaulospora colombiana]
MSEDTPAPPIQTSSEFPTGYGDFEILSSDNVAFSFPSGILAHVSPVFKDMFSIGSNNTNRHEALRLNDDAATIKQLLLFNDPLREPVSISKDTAIPFLEAAMKYQVSRMLSTFEKWALSMDNQSHYLHKEDIMMILSLAEKYRLQELGSAVMCHVIRAKKAAIFSKIHTLSLTTSVQVLENRIERTEWLVKKFLEFIKVPLSAVEKRLAEINENPHSRSSNPSPWHTAAVRATRDQICSACLARSHGLILSVITRLHSEPSWQALTSETQNLNTECQKCETNLWDIITGGNSNGATFPRSFYDAQSQWRALREEVARVESEKIPLKSLI